MLCYGLADYIRMKYGRQIVLIIFLSIYLIVLPNFYSFKVSKNIVGNEMFCGNYVFEYFEPNWFVGLTLILIAHIIYVFLLSRKIKTQK